MSACPTHFHEKRRSHFSGFSLIELIAVLGITSVLMFLMITGYLSVRSSSASIQCFSNLRHIYASTLAFVEDHEGLLPPDLAKEGVTDKVNPSWTVNQYWWGINYLGRYVLDQHDRSRAAKGQILAHEAVMFFNCPARGIDGSDDEWSTPQSAYPGGRRPRITYLMRKPAQQTKQEYLFHAIENKPQKLLFTEGVSSSLTPPTCKTGEFGSKDTSRRLRRYHNGAINILFMDGRIESFSGPDQQISAMLRD